MMQFTSLLILHHILSITIIGGKESFLSSITVSYYKTTTIIFGFFFNKIIILWSPCYIISTFPCLDMGIANSRSSHTCVIQCRQQHQVLLTSVQLILVAIQMWSDQLLNSCWPQGHQGVPLPMNWVMRAPSLWNFCNLWPITTHFTHGTTISLFLVSKMQDKQSSQLCQSLPRHVHRKRWGNMDKK